MDGIVTGIERDVLLVYFIAFLTSQLPPVCDSAAPPSERPTGPRGEGLNSKTPGAFNQYRDPPRESDVTWT
jgi:hypothetical protein